MCAARGDFRENGVYSWWERQGRARSNICQEGGREGGLVLPGLDELPEMVSQHLSSLEMLSASWQPGFRAGRDFVANPEPGMRTGPSISGRTVGPGGKC